jgi:hypothetical protein
MAVSRPDRRDATTLAIPDTLQSLPVGTPRLADHGTTIAQIGFVIGPKCP